MMTGDRSVGLSSRVGLKRRLGVPRSRQGDVPPVCQQHWRGHSHGPGILQAGSRPTAGQGWVAAGRGMAIQGPRRQRPPLARAWSPRGHLESRAPPSGGRPACVPPEEEAPPSIPGGTASRPMGSCAPV